MKKAFGEKIFEVLLYSAIVVVITLVCRLIVSLHHTNEYIEIINFVVLMFLVFKLFEIKHK